MSPHRSAARWLAAAAALGVAIGIGMGLPWSATAADSPQAGPLARLSRDQIAGYELKVAGAVDPAAASPSLVAILGDSRLKMMGYVRNMVFTADGRSIASAGNNEIAFWDARTGEQERVLRGHSQRVDALAISRDGRTLVSGSFDRLVKVWDVAGGRNGSRSRATRTSSPPWRSAPTASSSRRPTARSGSGTSPAAASAST